MPHSAINEKLSSMLLHNPSFIKMAAVSHIRKLPYLVLDENNPLQWRVEDISYNSAEEATKDMERGSYLTYSKKTTSAIAADSKPKKSTTIWWRYRTEGDAFPDQEDKDTIVKVKYATAGKWNTGVDFDTTNYEYQRSCALYIAHSIAMSFAAALPFMSETEEQPVSFLTLNTAYITDLHSKLGQLPEVATPLQRECQANQVQRSIIKNVFNETSKMLSLIGVNWEHTFRMLMLSSCKSGRIPLIDNKTVKTASASFINAGYLSHTKGGVRVFLQGLWEVLASFEKLKTKSKEIIAGQEALAQWDKRMNDGCLFFHADRIPIHMTLKLCTAESCVARGASAPVPGDLAMELTMALNPETSCREVSEFIHAPLGTKLTYYAFQEDEASLPILQKYNLDCQVLLHWACNGVRMIHTEESMQCALTLLHVLLPVKIEIEKKKEAIMLPYFKENFTQTFVAQLEQRVQQTIETLKAVRGPDLQQQAAIARFTNDILPMLQKLRSETNDDDVPKKVARVALKPDLAFEPLLITMLQKDRLTLPFGVCKALLSDDYGKDLTRLDEASIDVHVQASHILLAKLKTLGLMLTGEKFQTRRPVLGNQDLIAAVTANKINLYRHTVTREASTSGLALHREKTLVK